MWSILVVGNVRSLDEFYRGVAALLIAKMHDRSVNTIVNGEIPYRDKRLDHIAYRINIPIQVKGLTKLGNPLMAIEDSSSLGRLKERKIELKFLNVPLGYLHVKPIADKHSIIKLTIANEEENLYLMEVGV